MELELVRKFFARECVFLAGAASISALPTLELPEIAFIGRSNVGKSSLINSITGKKTVARTSNTPGRTRQLNFFAIDNALTLVDLPGYGYAKISKAELANWSRLIYTYLITRRNLQKICLLIDSRRGFMDSDHMMMDLLDNSGIGYQIILTKADKVSKTELENVKQSIIESAEKHPAMHPEVMATSSEKKIGIEQLQLMIYSYKI